MNIKQLDETSIAAKALSHVLDDLFELQNKIERKLEEDNKYKLEFEYHADDLDGVFISWKRRIVTKKKQCRIYVKLIEQGIERPFIELPVELRIECAKYLSPFLRAFREFLKEKADLIEDEVANLKAELECY